MNLTTVARILNQQYNKTELEQSFRTLARIFVVNNFDYLAQQGVSRFELDLSRQKTYNKENLSRLCAIPFSSKTIFHKFRDSLLNDTRLLLDNIIWVESLHQDDIEAKYNISVYTVTTKKLWNSYSRTEVTIKEQFKMFRAENAAGWYAQRPEFSLSLPAGLRQILAQYYETPENAKFLPLEEIEPTDYVYEQGEKDIFMELPFLMAYSSQDNIKVTNKGRPAATTIGKMQRKLNLKEFFPEEKKEKTLKQLRSFLLAGLVVTMNKKQMESGDTASMLKDVIFRKNYLNRFESAPIVLHHLKGMGYIDYDELPATESNMFNVLRRMPVDKWVSYENIEDFMRYAILEVKPIMEYAAANKLFFQYKDPEATYYTDKHYIRKGQYRRAIMEPFVKGCFFFFASFGLVDIAYNKVDVSTLGQTAFSPYDELKYVRLTPLGYYITGNTDIYVPPKGSSGSEILLSEDSLTIIVDAEDEVAGTLLEPYAERISQSRFQTDYRIFLKECRSKKELNNKINLFQQFISNELPSNWEAFFAELRRKIDPLDEIKDIRIFKIPSDNDTLIRLVARDAKLKKLVIKAEGYHLLIEKSKMSAFKKRLQEFGYFMTS